MGNTTIRTPARRASFLGALAECGNVTAAASVCGLQRPLLYTWRSQDPEFADAWDEALTLGTAGLEDEAAKQAMAGDSRLMMFLLSARKPEMYGLKQTLDVNHNHTMALRRTPLDALRAELAGLLEPAPIRALTLDHAEDATSVVDFPTKPTDPQTRS